MRIGPPIASNPSCLQSARPSAPTRASATTSSAPNDARVLATADAVDVEPADLAAVELELEKADSAALVGSLHGLEQSRDVTRDFKTAYRKARSDVSPLPKNAWHYQYLLVPGFLTEHTPTYFHSNLAQLKKRGLDVKVAPVDTDDGVRANAKVLRREILAAAKAGRKVILVGHSKGGVESTAVLSLYPELRRHVRAVVTMQSPLAGTALADDLAEVPGMRSACRKVLKLLGGNGRGGEDLRYGARRRFLEKYPYPTQVPTVSLTSACSDPRSLLAVPMAHLYRRYAERSDGLVTTRDGVLPGTRAVVLENLDHFATVYPDRLNPSPWQPGPLTEALIAVALQDPSVRKKMPRLD